MHSKDSWKEIFCKIMENPKKIELSIEIILKNKRGLELVISPFSDYQMCSEVFFSDQARGYF